MFAILRIAFVCLDRNRSSLHIWFVHSLFSFQRPIAHHLLRDSLFIISQLSDFVKNFLNYLFLLFLVRNIPSSNFYIISFRSQPVNIFLAFNCSALQTTHLYYHSSPVIVNYFFELFGTPANSANKPDCPVSAQSGFSSSLLSRKRCIAARIFTPAISSKSYTKGCRMSLQTGYPLSVPSNRFPSHQNSWVR